MGRWTKATLAILAVILLAALALIIVQPPSTPLNPNQQSSRIKIASFNIQVFGESKSSKPEVMSVLARTARKFDIMAVEEIRDDTGRTLPYFVDFINTFPGPQYAAAESPRLGRTSSKENYAFVYDTATVRLLDNYTFSDPPAGTTDDLFQREPFIARFASVKGNFDFVLIVIHTEPDQTPAELGNLTVVLDDARKRFPDEKDFILLGDMNADCGYLGRDENITLRGPDFIWLVPDSADTTVKSTDCAYDRIIITPSVQEDYDGTWGVFRFDQEFGLNQSQAEEVSDHYPVWAEFNAG